MAVIFSLAGCGSNTTGGSDMSDSHYSVSNEDNKTESVSYTHLGIQKKYDDRIVSRLLTTYDCLEFVGIDIRFIKRKNGEL